MVAAGSLFQRSTVLWKKPVLIALCVVGPFPFRTITNVVLSRPSQISIRVTMVTSPFLRRVHISAATKNCLPADVQCEPGNGMERDKYIKEKQITSFLVLNPESSATQFEEI
eukprot:sb/3477023/